MMFTLQNPTRWDDTHERLYESMYLSHMETALRDMTSDQIPAEDLLLISMEAKGSLQCIANWVPSEASIARGIQLASAMSEDFLSFNRMALIEAIQSTRQAL